MGTPSCWQRVLSILQAPPAPATVLRTASIWAPCAAMDACRALSTTYGTEPVRVAAKAKALLSPLDHREGLGVYLSDPRVPLDNSGSERILRGPITARYTCLVSAGPDGARGAALKP